MRPPDALLDTYVDTRAMSVQACQDLIALCAASITERGVCRIALAGGSTPKLLYGLMAKHQDRFDWKGIELYWGDERNVPADHADSNYRMVRETLLQDVPIPADNVHPVPIQPDDPAGTARSYEQTLRQRFASDQPRWDLVLLGIGDDAHTASLFPETEALREADRWFTQNWVPKFDAFRQTLTAPAINAARNIWFMVGGATKREAITKVWGATQDPTSYPSQLIRPVDGELRWMVTIDALPTA